MKAFDKDGLLLCNLQATTFEMSIETESMSSEVFIRSDIVNIGLHFFLKNVRPYAASCSEA